MDTISFLSTEFNDAMTDALKQMDDRQRLNVFLSVVLADDGLEETEAQSEALRAMSQRERECVFLSELVAGQASEEGQHDVAA